jgi:hypothetical protein
MMAHRDQLVNYFANTNLLKTERWVGCEIETFFVNDDGSAITFDQSQAILKRLISIGWEIVARKGDLVTEIRKGTSKILYEVGYPNIELAVCPHPANVLVERTRALLDELYAAAETCRAHPLFTPMYGSERNFLAVPDERDAAWLVVDGKKAFSPLSKISAVQFTVDVSVEDAIDCLNALNARRGEFLAEYPQDSVWQQYVHTSLAHYRSDRYGGPDHFSSLEHYCDDLARHSVIEGTDLVPFSHAKLEKNDAIGLFLRSVWWYFRLRRYNKKLCIEVRPLARRRDDVLQKQLAQVWKLVT